MTQIFDVRSYTGSAETWNVPMGVTEVFVDMAGAAGGSYSISCSGGLGGRLQAVLEVPAGGKIDLFIGEAGRDAFTSSGGGWNGGGAPAYWQAAGGGGASDIRIGGTALADRALVAGAGGGCRATSGIHGGAGGGETGSAGYYTAGGPGAAKAGQGGTQSAGGAAGCWWSGTDRGQNGGLGQGGNGGSSGGVAGGAGGGGYYGGGGGTDEGGGGGGSSYADVLLAADVTHTPGYRVGAGYITIVYAP